MTGNHSSQYTYFKHIRIFFDVGLLVNKLYYQPEGTGFKLGLQKPTKFKAYQSDSDIAKIQCFGRLVTCPGYFPTSHLESAGVGSSFLVPLLYKQYRKWMDG